jgi:hypothetical protein
MEESRMKMMDCVELIVEKGKYTKEGVHKGMQGVIWEAECKNGCWVVLFPQYGDKEDIADLYISEEDLIVIPVMDAGINERIKAQFENSGDSSKYLDEKPDDLSGYLI